MVDNVRLVADGTLSPEKCQVGTFRGVGSPVLNRSESAIPPTVEVEEYQLDVRETVGDDLTENDDKS
jgi:hypothetical protein